jgi:hypothetical protein
MSVLLNINAQPLHRNQNKRDELGLEIKEEKEVKNVYDVFLRFCQYYL